METVCLLSKLHEAKHHVNVKLDMDEMDITSAESKATYEEIKKYVLEETGLKVSNLYIAQVKISMDWRRGRIIIFQNRRMQDSQNAQRRRKRRLRMR